MKRFVYLVFFSALLLSSSTFAHMSFKLLDSKSCDSLEGQWTGKGKATNWLVGTCVYNGTGVVYPSDSKGVSTVQVTADKESGSFLCPNHTTENLKAVCSNGLISVKTQYGNINGTITPRSGQASGTLVVGPGIEAEVSLQFSR